MFGEIANFANDAAAVEKSLRLLQAFVQIAAGTVESPKDAKIWSTARGHFALARRYLRLFKWIDCGQVAKREWKTEADPVRRVIAVTKSGLLALYFFMEMFCITNAMQITTSPFLDALQHHALQVWFFAITTSLFLSSYDILSSPPATSTELIGTAYLLDLCDILIPGSAVGWIPADSVTVGVTSSISSLVAGMQIWTRVQKEAKEKELRRRVKQKVRFEISGEDVKDGVKLDQKVPAAEKAMEEKKLKDGDGELFEKATMNGTGNTKVANGGAKRRTKRA